MKITPKALNQIIVQSESGELYEITVHAHELHVRLMPRGRIHVYDADTNQSFTAGGIREVMLSGEGQA